MGKAALIDIDFKLGKFMANGTEYLVESAISVDRWNWYERQEVEVGLNIRFEHLYSKLQEQWDHINNQEFGHSAVICRDIIEGVGRNMQRRDPEVLKMCALFINTKDEDRRFITDDIIRKKIEDWREEGINMRSFFHFAIAIIPGYINAYKDISLDTLGRPVPSPLRIAPDLSLVTKEEPLGTGKNGDSQ